MNHYKTFGIYYLNPHIIGDKVKHLQDVKARSGDEAENKARRILRHTGMCFVVRHLLEEEGK